MEKSERTWKKIELFLSLFFGTFLLCAGGVWLHDNRQWLTHLFDTSAKTPRVETYAFPRMTAPDLRISPIEDWSKFTPKVNPVTLPKIHIPPPQIPQVRIPYIPPPPPPVHFRR